MSSDSVENPSTVSVVIPAYNVEQYIKRAIESVLSQTRRAQEVIIVDDASTDGTAEVIQQFGSDVKYIYQEKAGASVARNKGIETATSHWIAFLDADDQWLPEKLKNQMALMEHNPDLVWSYTNYIVRSTQDGTEKIAHDISKAEELTQGRDFFNDCFFAYAREIATHTITLMVRRDILLDVGMFLKGQKWAQDADLTFRIAYRWPNVGYISTPLSIHNFQTPGGITEKNWGLMKQRCEFLQRHMELSAEHDRMQQFRPCAEMLLKRWVRGMLNTRRFDQADEIPLEVENLLPKSMLREMRLCRTFPRIMPFVFKRYFDFKRFFRSRWKS